MNKIKRFDQKFGPNTKLGVSDLQTSRMVKPRITAEVMQQAFISPRKTLPEEFGFASSVSDQIL